MTQTEADRSRHPLFGDDQRERLKAIVELMHQVILKVLHTPGRIDQERILSGGASVTDILQESLIALLRYDASKLKNSWEHLAVGIARNKAVDAVRKATRGRRNASGYEIEIASLERELPSASKRPELVSTGTDPDYEFSLIYQQLVLRNLARDHLDDRERRIFYEIHYRARSGVDVGRELGISGTRVRQIYAQVTMRLHRLAHADPFFSASWEAESDLPRKEDG